VWRDCVKVVEVFEGDDDLVTWAMSDEIVVFVLFDVIATK